MHVVHAIHDFLPRHRAGSELYALALARAQAPRHDVTVLCADFDPARPHGHVRWRLHDGVPVVEVVNNWVCDRIEDTYRPPEITARLDQLLRVLAPDVLHVHNLLNLSFDLPAAARRRGIPVVATLHDYTLVCASGGQRVHRQDEHVCHDIDPARCARCFAKSPFHAQVAVGRTSGGGGGTVVGRAALAVRRRFPVVAAQAASAVRRVRGLPVTADAMAARLAAARRVFDDVDLWVAPSAAMADEYARLGLPRARLRVSDYGMTPMPAVPRRPPATPLRIGFVGTPVWHKGLHVLVEATALLPASGWQLDVFGALATFPDYAATLRARSLGRPIAFHDAFVEVDAAAVYRELDVLVVPSIWPENSPLVIHEAFQAGVAVVGSRIGGIPGLVIDGVTGCLFDPGSAVDLARVLGGLIAEPARAAALAAAAPPVKDIAADAAEWDARYAEVCGAPAKAAM